MNSIKTDILIIGTGIAGLSLAKTLAANNNSLSITIISKTALEECNTNYAQGGMAVVYDFIKDSFQQHIDDTLKAGKNYNNPKVVEHVITEAPDRLKELLDWGVKLDANSNGKLDLGLEGGHSQKRIVHHKDKTGQEIESKLINGVLAYPTITVLSSFFVVDLVIKNNICFGCVGFDKEKKPIKIKAKHTIVASGGCGQVFQITSNPSVATGDGIAMAIRANAQLKNMRFIQFHPTALYEPDKSNAFLLSEAIRGFGAYIVNDKGYRFLFDYTEQGELATRDTVSNAIQQQMKIENKPNMWLDVRHLNQTEFQNKFSKIYNYCTKAGYQLDKDVLPIVPAAHYQCGGIEVNKYGKTAINSLYAIGECSHTGLHGSNRLASNSLLEALVYANDLASELLINSNNETEIKKIDFPILIYKETNLKEVEKFRNQLKNFMNFEILNEPSIAHNTLLQIQNLKVEFLNKFENHTFNPFLCETFNMIEVALSIIHDYKLFNPLKTA